ncbi:hypothetical protein KC332_g1344 [Hortaea werneckii]|uniref:Matrin-type domain-containing protein n=2 Tax=Hortaea werneckii TaxID=91943 RepID=A0A3M7IGW6_HORWE|nr:hypothetical protein KC350_g4979 [Hortaea werneckii]OTA23709.1 hypothetical protein BTJ68_12814 [Hortaea werneckii EXF-2000]KAI6849172.1 hypothetical protein KC358_g1342 [Hortaea werneckii]KAI6931561.1 hypothetical protein KC341_g9546 [Hortaea werneckii]KAI6949615.1 hypothetical protein KC348_g1211 [Hortaea werneckii]
MAEYWKSTPSYWCKFCAIYVRDTTIERKNHEASGKHQNNIQRNLRELQKGKQRGDRDQQRAKDEVARLNGIVSGQGKGSGGGGGGGAGKTGILGVKDVGKAPAPSSGSTLSVSSQRKKHAEQLAAMGVVLPEELKREVTGVGGWQTVSEKVVEEEQPWSLADKNEEDSKEDVNDAVSRGIRKRKPEDDEDEEEAAPARKAWGSKFRQYPGAASEGNGEEEDLNALLSGVTAKKPRPAEVKKEENEDVKGEKPVEDMPLDSIPDVNAPAAAPVKHEEGEEKPAPAVVFKKRKAKK